MKYKMCPKCSAEFIDDFERGLIARGDTLERGCIDACGEKGTCIILEHNDGTLSDTLVGADSVEELLESTTY